VMAMRAGVAGSERDVAQERIRSDIAAAEA
jgi:hypothetical protein